MKTVPCRPRLKNLSLGGKRRHRDHSSSGFFWSSKRALPGKRTAPAPSNLSARDAIVAPMRTARPSPNGAPVNGRARSQQLGESIDEKWNTKNNSESKPCNGSAVLDIHIIQPFIGKHREACVSNSPTVERTAREEQTADHQTKENPYIPGAYRHLVAINLP